MTVTSTLTDMVAIVSCPTNAIAVASSLANAMAVTPSAALWLLVLGVVVVVCFLTVKSSV